ncbi:hypothetical protein SRHO_G00190870 [Serrasalmus rhombeus]
MERSSFLSYVVVSVLFQYSCSQTLTESDPVVLKPDQSHKLTCTASGLDIEQSPSIFQHNDSLSLLLYAVKLLSVAFSPLLACASLR